MKTKLTIALLFLVLILASCGRQAPATNNTTTAAPSIPVLSVEPLPQNQEIPQKVVTKTVDSTKDRELAQIDLEMEKLNTQIDRQYESMKISMKGTNDKAVKQELTAMLGTEQKRRAVAVLYKLQTKTDYMMTYPIMWNAHLRTAGLRASMDVSKFHVSGLEGWENTPGTKPGDDGIEVWFPSR